MVTTFTSTLLHTEKKQEKEAEQFPVIDQPSDQTINFILNYSKNLQVNKSKFISEISVIKS